MKIKLVQGDTSKVYKFQRTYEDGTPIKTLPKKMWLTVKENCYTDDCVLQKTLENGGIKFNEDDKYYRFRFESDETCDLPYGTYGFDIAILNENDEKITLYENGELKISEHFTKKVNEV